MKAFSTPMSRNQNSNQTLTSWLLDHICPYWKSAVVDNKGGFFEAVDVNGKAVRSPERSVLNQARLTYVFSHAYVMNQNPEMLKAAEHGFSFVRFAAQVASVDGGWHRMISVDGKVIDRARDAYDHAFVIFAMAWHYRASGNPEALELADRAYGFMATHLADPVNGGFFEEYPPVNGAHKLPRRQNPHMHLLEASLVMYETTGIEIWLERSKALVSLFERHFLDHETGSLAEYFNEDWSVVAGHAGVWREPGHQFEWVWLLGEFYRYTKDERVLALAGRLFEFGTKFGIDQDNIVLDGVNRSGKLVEESKLMWPQTEYIKACLARWEWWQEHEYLDEALAHVVRIRQTFFRADGATWHNQLSRSGEPLQEVTPSRVLYHIFLSLAEAIRLSGEHTSKITDINSLLAATFNKS